MKAKDIFNAITNIDHKLVVAAGETKRKRRMKAAGPIAAALAVTLAVLIIYNAVSGQGAVAPQRAALTGNVPLATAKYPNPADEAEAEDTVSFYDIQSDFGKSSFRFWMDSAQQLLADQEENQVYSPLNLYMMLAMVAEITEGNSRQQLLDLLGSQSMEELRQRAQLAWEYTYSCNMEEGREALLANSVWLDNNAAFKQPVLDTLAAQYYADSYRGDMGAQEYNQMLQDWLNEKTHGLLEEQAAGQEFPMECVLALCSTFYYKAGWEKQFDAERTEEMPFHTGQGDVDCAFLNRDNQSAYYWGENFGAVSLSLTPDTMLLVLPNEGVSPSQLLEDEEYQAFIRWYAGIQDGNAMWNDWQNTKYISGALSLPKFDISSEMDMKENLAALGVTDIFQSGRADFTPLSDEELIISAVKGATRVSVDEEGCTGASFVVAFANRMSAMIPPEYEEMDFILDRPFLFSVFGAGGLPLFMGAVNAP